MDKLMNLIGIEEVEEEPEMEPVVPHDERRPRKTSLVSLPGGGRPVRVVVAEPSSFDEVQHISDQLKSRRPVIVNLEGVEKDQAQAVLHFLSGTIYALDGQMQRVSTSIFLFAPPNVEVGREQSEPAERPEPKERAINHFFGK
ncbi:MAG: cell division protein SepF [Thermaerobacter sp.]|nr:cell division protein SepF [Thermaerobacter sp.]